MEVGSSLRPCRCLAALASHLPDGPPRLRLGGGPRQLRPPALALDLDFDHPDLRHILRTRDALGGVPQAPEAPPLRRGTALGYRDRLYGDHAVRPPGRVRPPVS